MLWFFTGCTSYSSSSISSFYQRTHSFIFNSLSTLYSFFSLIHYRCEWINTTLWINSSSYHWIIKWVCYYCKDIFKYTIWRHSTTNHSTLSFLLKRILLFLYSFSSYFFDCSFLWFIFWRLWNMYNLYSIIFSFFPSLSSRYYSCIMWVLSGWSFSFILFINRNCTLPYLWTIRYTSFSSWTSIIFSFFLCFI